MSFVRRVFLVVCLFFLFVFPSYAYSDSAPNDKSYAGSCYITCDTSQFGIIDIFVPVTYKTGYFGFSDNLCNVSNSTINGLFFDGGEEYSFRCSSWSTPQYRAVEGNYNQWVDLTVRSIEYSNIDIAEDYPPLVTESDILVYLPIVFLGVIVLCLFMKRF